MIYIIIAYIIILFIVAICGSGKVKSFEDYTVAGKKQTFMRVFLALMATMIGASATMGMADRTVEIGFPAFWWLGVGAIGLLLQSILLSEKIRSLNATTLPDIAYKTVGSGGKTLIALIIALSWIGIIGAQFLSIAKIISAMLPNININVILVVIATLVILYTIMGGQMSVIKIDSIQSWIILGGIVITFIYLLRTNPSDNEQIFNNIELLNEDFKIVDLINLFFITGGAYFLGPDIISRNLVSKDGKTAKRATLVASIVLAVFGILITIIAMWAEVNISSEVMAGKNPLIYIMSEYLPYPVSVLLCLALVSALISSADTCMINAASIIEHDLLKRDKVREVKLIVCGLGILGLLIAIFGSDIIGILMGAYSIYVPSIVIPLFIAIWFYKKKRIRKHIWYGAIIAGGILGLFNTYLGVGGTCLPLVAMALSGFLSILSIKGEKNL